MAAIRYLPWKEIVVHEVNEMTVPQFLEWIISQVEAQKQGGIGVARWMDGFAFAIGDFKETPETVAEKLKGTLHWAVINYAKTSYQSEKKIMWNGSERTVKLIKVEYNPDLANLPKFLQEFKRPSSGAAVGAKQKSH